MKAGEVRRAKVNPPAGGRAVLSNHHEAGRLRPGLRRALEERFGRERLAGLYARHRGKIVSENIIRQEAKILNATKQPVTPGPRFKIA